MKNAPPLAGAPAGALGAIPLPGAKPVAAQKPLTPLELKKKEINDLTIKTVEFLFCFNFTAYEFFFQSRNIADLQTYR